MTPKPNRRRESDRIDPISGLANRSQFLAALDDETFRARRTGCDLALILCDVARFKAANDGLGPLLGDRLLGRLGGRLRSVAPDAALLARISGDGFGVLLRDADRTPAICAALEDAFSRPFMIGGQVVALSVHIGVARLAAHAQDGPSLLHAADIALHEAQRVGGGMVTEFEDAMRVAAAERHDLETDLRQAVVVDEYDMQKAYACAQFFLAHQPKHCLRSGALTGFEALLRWRHPTRGPVSPAAFIPIAEDAGLIDLLGAWALRVACRDAAAWPQGDGPPLKVAVNMSPLQLRRGPLALRAVADALEESGLAPERLEIEVTESALVDDAVDLLTAIRDLGVGLALDDFGTGYSSLSRLSRFPFTTLKIDKAFVDALRPDDPESDWMIRAIVGLGAGLSMTTVVEGVEEDWRRARLAQAGCDEMQGYLASRPLERDAAAAYALTHVPKTPALEVAAE